MFTNWLVFHVASGQSFFTGSLGLIAAICLSAVGRRGVFRIARNALVFLGGALVFVSATPLAPWFYVLLLVASLAWLVGETYYERPPARLALGLRVMAAVLWSAAVLLEWPYHVSPRVPRLGDPILGIIGDSVTAGVRPEKVGTWPGIIADRHGVEVHDHSQAGANVATALRQAALVSSDERLVLLEIGGNDILGETSPAGFETGLAKLLSAVRKPGRVVVMLELPLPPTYNAFGRIQRRLARQYETVLVPKRVLLGVLQQQGTTLDSIHLSPEGHQRMADAIWAVVRGAYEDEKGRSQRPVISRLLAEYHLAAAKKPYEPEAPARDTSIHRVPWPMPSLALRADIFQASWPTGTAVARSRVVDFLGHGRLHALGQVEVDDQRQVV